MMENTKPTQEEYDQFFHVRPIRQERKEELSHLHAAPYGNQESKHETLFDQTPACSRL